MLRVVLDQQLVSVAFLNALDRQHIGHVLLGIQRTDELFRMREPDQPELLHLQRAIFEGRVSSPYCRYETQYMVRISKGQSRSHCVFPQVPHWISQRSAQR